MLPTLLHILRSFVIHCYLYASVDRCGQIWNAVLNFQFVLWRHWKSAFVQNFQFLTSLSCLFYKYTHTPPHSPPPIPLYHMLTLVSVTPALRKSSGTFMNFQMKNQRVKREKIINFFVNPTLKINVFYIVI